MRIFPVVTAGDETLKYVFPTKQRDVQEAIRLAKADERITRLILFGSSVTLRCGMNSDIDLAIDAPNVSEDAFLKIAHGFYRSIVSEVDVVHYNRIRSTLLKEEIDQKGVCVYARCN